MQRREGLAGEVVNNEVVKMPDESGIEQAVAGSVDLGHFRHSDLEARDTPCHIRLIEK